MSIKKLMKRKEIDMKRKVFQRLLTTVLAGAMTLSLAVQALLIPEAPPLRERIPKAQKQMKARPLHRSLLSEKSGRQLRRMYLRSHSTREMPT